MRHFLEIVKVQMIIFLRDPITLVITLVLPIFVGAFISFIFTEPIGAKIELAFTSEEKNAGIDYLLDTLQKIVNTDSISCKVLPKDETLSLLNLKKIDAAVIFPNSIMKSVSSGEESVITVFLSNRDPALAGTVQLLLEYLIAEMNIHVKNIPKVFTTVIKYMDTNEVSLAKFYFPNFLAISVLWLSIFATALTLVRDRESKILLKIGTTPVNPLFFIGAIVFWRLMVGSIQSLLFYIVGVLLMKIGIPANPILTIPAFLLGNAVFIAMGLMIASLSRSLQSAEVISQLINFAMMFFSGVFFIPTMIPSILKKVAYIFPLHYLADLYRQVLFGYPSPMSVYIDMIVLSFTGIVFTYVAYRNWRWA